MSKKISSYVIVAGALFLLVGGGLYVGLRRPSVETSESAPEKTATPPPSPTASPGEAIFSAEDVPGRAPAFTFSANIPTGWQVEAVPQIEALNIYAPSATGTANLEKSQVFISYFRASRFLTLSTVNILERREHDINGRPAITYVVEKKSGVPNFPSQPSWRNLKHRVTDIRVSDASPSIFYVFAKRPELSDAEFETFLNSLNLTPGSVSLYYPIRNFATGITKKPFGIFITPEDSPVQPERFRGYHTGADIESPDASAGSDPATADEPIPIFAIADGTVALSQTASGYGGVLAIRHTIEGESILAIYGHLKAATMVKSGAAVKRGQQIALLGKGFGVETDFERQHLHFGLYWRSDTNIKGYVNNREELKAWYDPQQFLRSMTIRLP